MNILLINHYAGSVRHGMEYRPYYLAREWVRQGHNVHIVAASHSHVRTQSPLLHDTDRLDEVIDGIRYTWFATPSYAGNGFSRVRNIFAFIGRLLYEAKELARLSAPDVVIASSTYPLDIFPARRIARFAGARLFYELHDLWPLSPIELGGFSRWHPFIMLLQAAENHACRHADGVISLLPKVAEHLQAHGMAPQKLHILPNGADPAEWCGASEPLPSSMKACLGDLRDAGVFIVGYAGSHGIANALEYLIDAANSLRHRGVAFVLVGGGPEKAALCRHARALGLTNVYFFDAIAKSQIPTFLRRIDLAYIGWQRQPLYRFGIAPNKLIDYMMSGRPILHAVDAGNDLVAEARCGLTVPPESASAIANGILAVVALTPDTRIEMGHRGRRFALEHLSYPVLGKRFLQILFPEARHG